MLNLTRGVKEKIRIHDDIIITVESNDGHVVKLSFDAPIGVKIYREELYQKMQRNDEKLVNSLLNDLKHTHLNLKRA